MVCCGNKIYEVTYIGITPYGSDKVSVWGKRKRIHDIENVTTANVNTKLDIDDIRVKRSKKSTRKNHQPKRVIQLMVILFLNYSTMQQHMWLIRMRK